VNSNELKSKLTELRILCESDIPGTELNEMISQVEKWYSSALRTRRAERRAGMFKMEPSDLYRVHEIVNERAEQLATDT